MKRSQRWTRGICHLNVIIFKNQESICHGVILIKILDFISPKPPFHPISEIGTKINDYQEMLMALT